MDPFSWNILNFTRKLKWFYEHLIRERDFWYKKPLVRMIFLECFKHIKWLLKHGEFSWKFCSCNFESTKIYFKNRTFFLRYIVSMVSFQIFKKQFLRIVHTLHGSFYCDLTFSRFFCCHRRSIIAINKFITYKVKM
jgi:hypothetical protein